VDGNELWTALKRPLHTEPKRLLTAITTELIGTVTLPYPHFSSKTVRGKPLHTWALENRLDEIEVPTKTSTIYELEPQRIEWVARTMLCEQALVKIDTISPVTDVRKALGNDFRRADVRADWRRVAENDNLPDVFPVAHFRCIASSGTYMRTLAHLIAHRLGTTGLAWHIHRTGIGRYQPGTGWTQRF
jgi:tRNA U55 pseudouridine synthase TruB